MVTLVLDPLVELALRVEAARSDRSVSEVAEGILSSLLVD